MERMRASLEGYGFAPPIHHLTGLRPPAGEVLSQDVWDRLTGLEILRGLMSGELPAPPFAHFTGGRWTGAEEGTAEFTMPMTEWMNSPALRVYGGTIALLADIALVGAVQTTVPARTAFSPLDLKVHFVRA